MKITNPTSDDIKVSIKGEPYFIEAKGTLDNVPEAHARQWQESLHKFLILRKDGLENKPETKVVEVPLPPVEEKKLETIVIKSKGEVGIAQSSPSAKLDVGGSKLKKVVAKKTKKVK